MVPTYRPEVDDPALAYYQELLPGYNVVGIDVDNQGENLIALLGALHCITHTIGVEDPLWIVHQPVDEANITSTVTIDAMIKHISGVNNAKVFWREEGGSTFNETPMTFVSDDMWTADLNIASTNVEYYIFAEANSGKTIARPIVAPDGYWTISVEVLSNEEWAENHISGPYPNPTTEKVSFNFENIPGPISVSIHNLLGQNLMEKTIDNGNGVITIDLLDSWNGALFVSFDGEFGTIHRRIIKL